MSEQLLIETIQNLLGAFDTPLRRMKFPSDFGDEACQIARDLLVTLGKKERRIVVGANTYGWNHEDEE